MKRLISTQISTILLLLLLFPLACGASIAPVVATINGYPITAEDFSWAFNRIQRVLAAQGTPVNDETVQSVRQMTLQGLMKNELLFLEGEALGIKVESQAVEQEVAQLKQQFPDEKSYQLTLDELQVSEGTIRRAIIRGISMREQLVKVFVPEVRLADGASRQYYLEHPEQFLQPELVRASQILIAVAPDAAENDRQSAREKIEKLQQRLQQGEDFATVAKSESQCPSAKNGGDLGYFRKGQLIAEMEMAAFALKPGQVSEIVASEFGFHLIRVTDHKKEQILSFEQVEKELEKRLILQQAQSNAASFVEQRLASAEVKIFFDDLKLQPENRDE